MGAASPFSPSMGLRRSGKKELDERTEIAALLRLKLGTPAGERGAASASMVYSEVGAQRGSWKRPLLGFFETCGGCKAFVMACNWPFCGPCIFARISARVAWPKTTFSAFGDTPFLQWFRISLLLVCIYWACSWGEGVAAPTPKSNVIAGDLVDVRALDKLDDVGSTLAANATGDADIASEGKEIENKIKAGMAKVDRYGEIKSLEFAESRETALRA